MGGKTSVQSKYTTELGKPAQAKSVEAGNLPQVARVTTHPGKHFFVMPPRCRGSMGLGTASYTQCLQSSRKPGEQRIPAGNVDLAKCVQLKGKRRIYLLSHVTGVLRRQTQRLSQLRASEV